MITAQIMVSNALFVFLFHFVEWNLWLGLERKVPKPLGMNETTLTEDNTVMPPKYSPLRRKSHRILMSCKLLGFYIPASLPLFWSSDWLMIILLPLGMLMGIKQYKSSGKQKTKRLLNEFLPLFLELLVIIKQMTVELCYSIVNEYCDSNTWKKVTINWIAKKSQKNVSIFCANMDIKTQFTLLSIMHILI